jgi:hypothetical protein
MASNGQLVSLKQIADTLYQNPLMKDMQWEFIIDRAVELLRLLKVPSLYKQEKEIIEIKNFKGDIPFNSIKTQGIFRIKNNGLIPMVPGNDILQEHLGEFSPISNEDLTYKLAGGKISVKFETGRIAFVYSRIATDENCYPLILNDAALIRAIRHYIQYQWYDILNDMEMVSDRKLNKAEQNYSFSVAQASNSIILPDEDEMETIVNMMTQALPNRDQHSQRFAHLHKAEYLKTH